MLIIRKPLGGAAAPTVTRNGKKTVEVVYHITSDRDADPATLAAWVRSHGEIENRLHWVRDVGYQEDKSQVWTGNAPRVMASLRSLATSILRLDGHTNIAAANRHHARSGRYSCFRPHKRLWGRRACRGGTRLLEPPLMRPRVAGPTAESSPLRGRCGHFLAWPRCINMQAEQLVTV